jgi:hypothetical protein
MNHLLIRILKLIVNAAWYLLIPLFIIVSVVIGYKIVSMGYVNWDIPVYLKKVNMPGVNNAMAVLKLNVKLTPALAVIVAVFFSCTAFLLFSIIHQLRKVLNTLKKDQPFAVENIKRLRLISLFVFLFAVIEFIDSLYDIQLLQLHFQEANELYKVKIAWGFTPLIISMVVLILSEIFKQGYQLKTDNESFI